MSTLSWQAGNASGSFLTGTIVQALITLNHDTYEAQSYQGTLLVFAMVVVLYIVNIWAAQVWPKIQNGLMILHILGFLVVIIVMVGQITAIYAMLGEFKDHGMKYLSLTKTRVRCDRSHCGRSQRCWSIRTYLHLLELLWQRNHGNHPLNHISLF